MRSLPVAVQPQADPSDVLSSVPSGTRAPAAERALRPVVQEEQEQRDRESGGAAPWEISDHAVYRYRERCPGKRDVSLAQAVKELTELATRAHFVKVLPSGLDLWRGGRPHRLRYRVERTESGLRLVTVLRGCDARV